MSRSATGTRPATAKMGRFKPSGITLAEYLKQEREQQKMSTKEASTGVHAKSTQGQWSKISKKPKAVVVAPAQKKPVAFQPVESKSNSSRNKRMMPIKEDKKCPTCGYMFLKGSIHTALFQTRISRCKNQNKRCENMTQSNPRTMAQSDFFWLPEIYRIC